MISGTRATKNELVMDLAKTKAQVAQVQEKPTWLQIIGGYKICIKIPHLQSFHRACASTIRDKAMRLFLFLSSSFYSFSLFYSYSFSSHFACQQELYQLAHATFARNTIRYQVCKTQAIIDEQVSIGYIGTNDLANKWGKVGEEMGMLYLLSTIFNLGLECPFLAHEIWPTDIKHLSKHG